MTSCGSDDAMEEEEDISEIPTLQTALSKLESFDSYRIEAAIGDAEEEIAWRTDRNSSDFLIHVNFGPSCELVTRLGCSWEVLGIGNEGYRRVCGPACEDWEKGLDSFEAYASALLIPATLASFPEALLSASEFETAELSSQTNSSITYRTTADIGRANDIAEESLFGSRTTGGGCTVDIPSEGTPTTTCWLETRKPQIVDVAVEVSKDSGYPLRITTTLPDNPSLVLTLAVSGIDETIVEPASLGIQ